MVEALKTWVGAYQVAFKENNQWELTAIADLIFGAGNLDPCLDDITSAWVLHWQISTNRIAPFWAWECLFNRWPATEFTASEVLSRFREKADESPRRASTITLKQHWEVFLHTYQPPRLTRGEDNLDSALSGLGLIRPHGERINADGRKEKVYMFDNSEKQSISQQLFAFCVHDWWNKSYPKEETVPFGAILGDSHSPGRIFRMQEDEVARRLTDLAKLQPKVFRVMESASLRQLHRTLVKDGISDLRAAYRNPKYISK
jgi:hypothetical protein